MIKPSEVSRNMGMSYRQSLLKPKGCVLFNKNHLVLEKTHKLSFLRSDKNLFSVLLI